MGCIKKREGLICKYLYFLSNKKNIKIKFVLVFFFELAKLPIAAPLI